MQRLDKYKASADQATADGNSGKVKRMGRIVKVSSFSQWWRLCTSQCDSVRPSVQTRGL